VNIWKCLAKICLAYENFDCPFKNNAIFDCTMQKFGNCNSCLEHESNTQADSRGISREGREERLIGARFNDPDLFFALKRANYSPYTPYMHIEVDVQISWSSWRTGQRVVVDFWPSCLLPFLGVSQVLISSFVPFSLIECDAASNSEHSLRLLQLCWLLLLFPRYVLKVHC